MKKNKFTRYEARAEVFKALAHPTRLLMVEALSKQEHCVCELREMVGADVSTVSKHLSILKNAGIVNDEKRSQMVYYSLAMPCVLKFMACIETAVHERVKAQLETLAG